MIDTKSISEERVVLSDGKTFVPVHKHGCQGCVFQTSNYSHLCDGRFDCAAIDRKDGKSIIWVITKNQPHPYAELIKAWADGEKIEEFDSIRSKWVINEHPSWDIITSYRIAEPPKQDVIKYFFVSQEEMIPVKAQKYANVQFTFDGETGKLKSVEMVKKND